MSSDESLKIGGGCLVVVLWNVVAVIVGIVTANLTGEICYGVVAFLAMVAIMIARWVRIIRNALKGVSN